MIRLQRRFGRRLGERALVLIPLVLASLIPLGEAQGARAIAVAGWLGVDFSSATAPLLTTEGRACVDPVGAPPSETPVGACTGALRGIPPVAAVGALSGVARANQVLIPGGKKLTAFALRLLPLTKVEAEAKDPITWLPYPEPREIRFSISLDSLVVGSEADGIASLHVDFETDLGNASGEPLFTLDIRAEGGGVPVVDFRVSSYLAAQGWDEGALEDQLWNAFGEGPAGEFGAFGFELPPSSFVIPAGVEASFYNDQRAVTDDLQPTATESTTWGTVKHLYR